MTAMMRASNVSGGRVEIVKKLLAASANPNLQNNVSIVCAPFVPREVYCRRTWGGGGHVAR